MNIKSLVLLSLALGVSVNLPAISPLPSGKAPVKVTVETKKYEGDVLFDAAKLTFTYGNKRLQFWKNGVFSVFCDNRELSKGYVMIATPYQYWQINETAAPTAKGYDGKQMRVTEIKTEGKKVTFFGKIPWNRKGHSPSITGNWKITAEAVGKGRIKVEWYYNVPDGQKRVEDGVFISMKHCKELDAGKLGRFIPGTGKDKNIKKYLNSMKKTILTQVGINTADTYRIESSCWKMQFEQLRLRREGDTISAVFDFTGSAVAGKTANKAGGVDLLAVDALTVPERGRNMLPNPYLADKYKFINFHSSYVPPKDMISTDAKFGRYSFARVGWTKFATVPADAGDYVFSFYAKGKGKMSVMFTSAGRDFERSYPVQLNSPDQWKRYEIPFRFPVNNAITFELRMPTRNLIDGMQLEKGKKATPFEAPAVEVSRAGTDFFDSGSDIKLEYELNTLQPRVTGKGTISIKNFFGEQVYKKDFNFDVSAGKYPKLTVTPGKLPDGIYVINFKYGKTAPEQFYRFAIMPFMKNTHKTARVFSINYYGHLALQTQYEEKKLERLQRIGIGSDGHSCLMTPNVLDLFAKYNVIPFDIGFFNRADSAKMAKLFPELKGKIPPGRMWFYISDRLSGHSNNKGILPDYRLVGGWTPEYRKKFVATVASLVRTYPQRYAYSFASEGPGEVKNDKNYIDLYIAYREAVKSVYPTALVYEAGEPSMGILSGNIQYDQILTRMESKTVTDFAGAHTYDKDIRKIYTNFIDFLKMLNRHKGYEKCRIALPEGMHFYPYNIPAWNFEQICWNGEGWRGTSPSYDLGWSEKISAAYYARCWLIFLTEFDRVWCVTSSAENVGNFRLDYSYAPRAFQKIPNTLGLLLGNPQKFLGNFTFAPDTMCLVWEDEKGRPVAAVWNEDPAVDAGFKDAPMAKMNYHGAEYIDLMGVARKPEKDGEFPVSPFPLFIRGKAGDSAAFTNAIVSAVLSDPGKMPCRISFSLQSADTVKLTLINPLARELSGTLDVFGRQHKIRIAKNSETSLPIKLQKPVRTGKAEIIRIPYIFKVSGLTIQKEFVLHCFLVPKFNGDWNKIPAIQLTNYKKGKIPDKKDLSASYQLAWTPKALRLRVKVTDDVFAPGSKPGYRWQNDILQVYFDTQCSAMKTGKKENDYDDYEYGFMPTLDGKRCEVWRDLSPDIQLTLGIAAPKNKTIAKEIPAKFTRTADGYIYEVEFPADYILPIRLMKGYHFAFGMFIADKDRGKTADKFVTNATEPHSGCHNKPHVWPIAVLTE